MEALRGVFGRPSACSRLCWSSDLRDACLADRAHAERAHRETSTTCSQLAAAAQDVDTAPAIQRSRARARRPGRSFMPDEDRVADRLCRFGTVRRVVPVPAHRISALADPAEPEQLQSCRSRAFMLPARRRDMRVPVLCGVRISRPRNADHQRRGFASAEGQLAGRSDGTPRRERQRRACSRTVQTDAAALDADQTAPETSRSARHDRKRRDGARLRAGCRPLGTRCCRHLRSNRIAVTIG